MGMQNDNLKNAWDLYQLALTDDENMPNPTEWINNRVYYVKIWLNWNAYLIVNQDELGDNTVKRALGNVWANYQRYMYDHFFIGSVDDTQFR